MIKHYCDICGELLTDTNTLKPVKQWRKFVDDTAALAGADVTVTLSVTKQHSRYNSESFSNVTDICVPCVHGILGVIPKP